MTLTPLQLVALAVLDEAPQHPYDAYRVLLERREDRVVRLKAGTLYHAIARLADAGLVEATGVDRAGGRPERTTYRITEQGRAALRDRVGTLLEAPEQEFPGFVLAISEARALPADDVAARLARRADALERHATELAADIDALEREGTPRAHWLEVGLQRHLALAEATWTRGLAEGIRTGGVPWPDAAPDASADASPDASTDAQP